MDLGSVTRKDQYTLAIYVLEMADSVIQSISKKYFPIETFKVALGGKTNEI